jgi:hypothetical protein
VWAVLESEIQLSRRHAGHVDPVFLAAAQHGFVGELAVEQVVGEHHPGVARHGVGLVDGDRIGETHVSCIEVTGEQFDLAVWQPDAHGALRVDVEDHSTVAIADADPRVVAEHHHLVASPHRNATDLDGRTIEVAGCLGADVPRSVQLGHVGSAAGEHDRIVAPHGRRPPVPQQEHLGVVGVVPDGDPIVPEVGVERVGRVAVTQLAQRLDLPLVLLATVIA